MSEAKSKTVIALETSKPLNTEQQAIIDAAFTKPIVVSASAGTGKTEVLARKIVDEVLRADDPISLQEVLVLTFTNKAAINMQSRIVKTLQLSLASTSDEATQAWIQEQIKLAPLAQITTIDAFCVRLLREYLPELVEVENIAENTVDRLDEASALPLQAGFGIASDVIATRLLQDAVSEVLNELDAMVFLANQNPQLFDQEVVCGDTTTSPFFNLDEVTIKQSTWLEQYEKMGRIIAPGKSNEKLGEVLLDHLDTLRSMTDYANWCRRQITKQRNDISNFEASEAAIYYLEQLHNALEQFRCAWPEIAQSIAMQALHECAAGSKSKEIIAFAEFCHTLDTVFQELIQTATTHQPWDYFVALGVKLKNACALTNRATKGLDGETKEKLRRDFGLAFVPLGQLLGVIKNKSTQAKEFGLADPLPPVIAQADLLINQEEAVATIARFCEVLLLVDRAYTRQKRRRNLVDFADVEHLAQKLLQGESVRQSILGRIKLVFVDEYQDTNDLQEAIIERLLPERTFVVGDFKQSIYAFRHARPELMQKRIQTAIESKNQVIELYQLKRNYRSTAKLHAFVNVIFDQILTNESFGADYNAAQWLVSGRDSLALPCADVTLAVLSKIKDEAQREDQSDVASNNEAAEVISNSRAEVELALTIINELRQNEIAAGSIGYGDIAILTRTNAQAQEMQQGLANAGVPVRSTIDQAYFETNSFYLWYSILQLIDDETNEYALASFFKSEFAPEPLSDYELLQVANWRKHQPEVSLISAVRTEIKDNGSTPIAQKLVKVLSLLENWRKCSQAMALTDLFDLISSETQINEKYYDSESLSFQDGTAQFREMISNIEAQGFLTLSELLAQITLFCANPRESLSFFDVVSAEENVVQILTMHGSKGLEFKVVLLAGLNPSKVMNHSTRLALSRHGISMISVDSNINKAWQNPNHAVHKAMRIQDERAEMLRLLYVALTRAERKTYLLCVTEKDIEEFLCPASNLDLVDVQRYAPLNKQLSADIATVEAMRDQTRVVLGNFEAQKIKKMIDPIRYAFGKDLRRFLQTGVESPFLKLAIYTAEHCSQGVAELSGTKSEAKDLNAQALENIGVATNHDENKQVLPAHEAVQAYTELLKSVFIHAEIASERQPAKISVSELKRNQEIIEAQEDGLSDDCNYPSDPMPYQSLFSQRGMKHEQNSVATIQGAELGTALHAVFQYMDFADLRQNPYASEVKRQILAMIEAKQITELQGRAAEAFSDELVAFAKSELFLRLPSDGDAKCRSYREMPFSFIAPQNGTYDYAGTLIQGVIDLWFTNEDESITLVDFKSDQIRWDEAQTQAVLQERYGTQLRYYKMALEQATGRNVRETLIWLIRYGKELKIDTSMF